MPGQTAELLDTTYTTRVRLEYLLYLPKEYDTQEAWPLVLFLHGAGERGSDISLVTKHGLPKRIANGDEFPLLVVSPQCPQSSWWPAETLTLRALLDDVQKRYRIDLDRVYVTGLSMGGYGTWRLAVAQPDRFAAAVPICGGLEGPPQAVDVLKKLPIWVFHGAKDETVPVEQSQRLVDRLQEIGGDVRMTVYPEAGHDSWTQAYDDPELYDWLLSQSR